MPTTSPAGRARPALPAAAALAVLLALLGAPAQALTVVSATPADYATGLPTATTLTLTFSEAVADPAVAPPSLVVLPLGQVAVGEATRSADGRTLSVPLTLPADARVVVLLVGATAESGAALARPFALNLTTAASAGTLIVRGAIRGTGGLAPDGSIVTLVTGDLATGAIQIVAAAVVSGSAASLPYALGPVPLGLYTAGAVRLTLPLGAPGPVGFGLYDPDGDGTPNPILFPTGVNVTVAPPAPRTAGDGFAEIAAAAANALGPAPRLVALPAQPVSADGRAAAWLYRFEGAADAEATVLRLGLFVLPLATPDGPTGAALPVPFADTDAVLAAAEAAGGAAFRARFPPADVAVTAGVEAAAAPAWAVRYTAPGDSLVVRVDVATGVVGAEAAPGSGGLALRLAAANPARGPLAAVLALDAPAHARVRVVDVLGRTVAVLADGPLGAGAHALRWTPAAPGAYRVVAEAAGRRAVLAVVRL